MHPARFLPLATVALLALAGPAQGQQAGAAVLREAEDGAVVVQPFGVSVDDLEDADLVGADGEGIGEVEQVLVDEDGQPAAVAAEVGGFLGLGERAVVIGLDRLRLADDGDDLVTTLTREELEGLDAWGGR